MEVSDFSAKERSGLGDRGGQREEGRERERESACVCKSRRLKETEVNYVASEERSQVLSWLSVY